MADLPDRDSRPIGWAPPGRLGSASDAARAALANLRTLDGRRMRGNSRRLWGHLARSFGRRPEVLYGIKPPVWARPADLAGFGLIAAFVALMFLDPVSKAWALSYDDSVRSFFYWVTRWGKADWFLWPLGLTLLAIMIVSGFEWPRRIRAVLHHWGMRLGFIGAAVGIPGLTVSLIKLVVGRARPDAPGSAGLFDITGFAFDADFQSFPSGHTTNAITLAIAFTVLWPRYWVFFLSFPIVIATSRVMTLDHYPSDVMAAWLFGSAGVLWIRNWCARRKLVFRPCPSGRIVRRRLPRIERATGATLRAMGGRLFNSRDAGSPGPRTTT